MNSRYLAAAALLSSTALFARAEAAVVLDQTTFTANGNGSGYVLNYPTYIDGRFPLTQTELETVTAGVAGTLTELDLKMSLSSGTGDYQVVLFDHGHTDQAAYDYTGAVYTADLRTTSTTSEIVKIDLSSADFHVTPGQVFSFSIRPDTSSSGNNVVQYDSSPKAYAGGENYISPNSGLPYNYYAYRGTAQFQTFVDNGLPAAAAAPEPATWAMMILGLGAVGIGFRRRHASTANA